MTLNDADGSLSDKQFLEGLLDLRADIREGHNPATFLARLDAIIALFLNQRIANVGGLEGKLQREGIAV